MKAKGYALAAFSALFYGLIPLFVLPIKAEHFSLDTTLFYRFFMAALLLLGYLLYKKESLKLNKTELACMVALGLFFALSSECLFMGYDYLSAGIASSTLFVYPVIVALIMVFFFKEKLNLLTVLSLVVTLLGVLILNAKGKQFKINPIGISITLLSALFYALYIVLVNKAKISFSGVKTAFYSILFTTIYFLIKVVFLKESLAIPSLNMLFNFAIFALVTTVLSILALVYAIQTIGSTPTSIMGALEPIVAVAISVLLFHEQLTSTLITGGLLIIIGVIVNIVAEDRKNKRHPQLKPKI